MTPDVKCSRRKLFSSLVKSCTVHRVWSHIWLQATCDLISVHRKRLGKGWQGRERLFGPLGVGKGDSSVCDFSCDLTGKQHLACLWGQAPQPETLQLLAGALTIALSKLICTTAIIPSNSGWLCYSDLFSISLLSFLFTPSTHSILSKFLGQPSWREQQSGRTMWNCFFFFFFW